MPSANVSSVNPPKLNFFLQPRVLLIAVLIAQTVFFVVFANATQGKWLRGDNFLYETPAQNFARGNGLTIDRREWEDPYLTELYYQTHPDKIGSDLIPTTTVPIGYSYFLGGVYSIFGRNHLAAIGVNLLLLYAALFVMYLIAKRAFGNSLEFYLTMGLMLIFPMWAVWAATIVADTLHVLLLTVFALLFFRRQPTVGQVVLAGLMLGLASLVRPYSTLLPIALFVGGLVFRGKFFSLKNTVLVAAICWLMLGGWALRNYYEFGKPMLTSMGLGHSIFVNTHKNFLIDLTDAELAQKIPPEIKDFHFHRDNQRMLELAIERIKADPVRDVAVALTSIPRLWLTLGAGTSSLVKIILLLIFGSLFILMLVGMYLARKSDDPIIIGAIVTVTYYTLIFAHLSTEGRYIVPARFFAFLLVAIALAYILKRFFPAFFEKNRLILNSSPQPSA